MPPAQASIRTSNGKQADRGRRMQRPEVGGHFTHKQQHEGGDEDVEVGKGGEGSRTSSLERNRQAARDIQLQMKWLETRQREMQKDVIAQKKEIKRQLKTGNGFEREIRDQALAAQGTDIVGGFMQKMAYLAERMATAPTRSEKFIDILDATKAEESLTKDLKIISPQTSTNDRDFEICRLGAKAESEREAKREIIRQKNDLAHEKVEVERRTERFSPEKNNDLREQLSQTRDHRREAQGS